MGTSNNYFNTMMVLGTTEVILPSSYNYVSTGSLQLSGIANLITSYKNYISTGSLQLSGIALAKLSYKNYISTGSLQLSGIAIATKNNKNNFYTASGSLQISSISLVKMNYKFILTNTLQISGNFLASKKDKEDLINLNYILTGPSIVNLDFNNIYFNLEIINDFNEQFEAKIATDKNISYNIENPITEQNTYFYIKDFTVGNYELTVESTSSLIKLNGNKLNIKVISSNPKEGLYPKIVFKIDFNISDLNNEISDFKTISIPILNKTLKNNDTFTLYGSEAIYFKNNILPQYKDLIRII